jgi:hypothetical protein
MGRHPVAVVILHITYARTMKIDYSRFSWGGLHGRHVVVTWKRKTATISAFAPGPRKTKRTQENQNCSKLHFFFPFCKSYKIFRVILRSCVPFIKELKVFNGGRGFVIPPPSFQSEGRILVDSSQLLSHSNIIYSPFWNAVSSDCKGSRWEEMDLLDWDKINWYKATFEVPTALLMEIPALSVLTSCRMVLGTNLLRIFLALSTGYSEKCDCHDDGSSKLLHI